MSQALGQAFAFSILVVGRVSVGCFLPIYDPKMY